MTAFVLVTGSLWKNPEQRSSSKSGKLFVTATLKDDAEFWSVTAFSESAQAELLRLGAGDALSAQGKLEIKTYTGNDGSQKIGRSIVADSVLALRAPPKERKPKAAKPAPTAQDRTTDATPETAAGGPAFFDDQIPFEAAR
jgi:single-stranded DNA-binding protein